jgi:hypothetical protein
MTRRVTQYLRRHAVAYLALFLALSGGAYAAVKLPANSVGTKQLKNKAVTRAKLSPSTIRQLQGRTGPKGDKGDKGDSGAQGQAGAPGQDGKNGGAVTARARESGSDVTVPGGSLSEVNVPLTGDTWTQGANELDQIFVQVTVTSPATCTGFIPGMAVTARVDGQPIVGAGPNQFGFGTPSSSSTVGGLGGFLMEPGADTPHTLTLVIRNFCDTGQDYTLTAAAIDVGAFL